MAVSRSAFHHAMRLQSTIRRTRTSSFIRILPSRSFHISSRLDVVKPFLLADIGEGITECQLIQWFVQPGARVEQFDKICEVQSDKASVEITSPFDGVIKKLYYEPDDMAITGKPLVDIDIESDISEADAQQLGNTGEDAGGGRQVAEQQGEEAAEAQEEEAEGAKAERDEEETVASANTGGESKMPPPPSSSSDPPESFSKPPTKHDRGTLATPAVRRLTKEHNISLSDIPGTGKDGRVLKEDVFRYISGEGQQQQQQQPTAAAPTAPPVASKDDRKVSLTAVQNQMFKTMTKSLNIPHFLYSSAADMTAVTAMRGKLNARAQSSEQKVTHLAFIIKALSLALLHHPLLNSHLNTSDPKKPELTHMGSHNFGVAIDAPSGLLVPVLKNVQDLTITEIAANLRQLGEKARSNKLAPGDFKGATFTVSNIGAVGGGVVAPVISEPQVAIVAIGRSKVVPAFDEDGELVKKEELVLNWSADHRVVDGAECARCAERLRGYLEDPASFITAMR